MNARLVPFIFTLLFSFLSHANDTKLTKLNDFRSWEPNQIQEVQIRMDMPKGFHAYLDQIKVQQLKPDGFKAGEIRVKPEVEFFDKYSKKTRKGLQDTGVISILIEASDPIPAILKFIQFNLRYQVCNESVCFLPKSLSIEV